MADKTVKLSANTYKGDIKLQADIISTGSNYTSSVNKNITSVTNYDEIKTGISNQLSIFTDISDILHDQIPDNSNIIGRFFEDKISLFETLEAYRIRLLSPGDINAITDVKLLSFSKIKSDFVSNSEVVFRSIGKNVTNSVHNFEILNKNILKNIVDDPVLNDLLIKSTSKLLNDIFSNSDIVTNKIVAKQLLDNVDATDDFLGETIADDDQSIQFIKIITHLVYKTDIFERLVNYVRNFSTNALAQEIISKALSKIFLEASVISDPKNISVSKNNTDTVNETDILNKQYDKNKQDTVFSLSEITAKDLFKNKLENLIIAESVNVQAQKYLEELKSIADNSLKSVDKNLADIPIISELLSKEYNKSIIDSVSITQQFQSLLSVIESQTSSSSVSDSVLVTALKNFSESVNSTQTVEIYKRSYFLEDYTSGRYVGDVYTF